MSDYYSIEIMLRANNQSEAEDIAEEHLQLVNMSTENREIVIGTVKSCRDPFPSVG